MTCVIVQKFINLYYICLFYSLILFADAKLCEIINSQAKELEDTHKELDNTYVELCNTCKELKFCQIELNDMHVELGKE